MHAGKLIARALKKSGVECVFTLSGGHIMPIYDGCLDEGIRIIDVRHEQAAVHAADAWARLHPGRVGVRAAHRGPGRHRRRHRHRQRLARELADPRHRRPGSARESPPRLAAGDGPHLASCARSPSGPTPATRPIAPASTSKKPIRHALAGNPGPAYLEIPMDVLFGAVDLDTALVPGTAAAAAHAYPDPRLVEAAIELLAKAKRPMVMAGTGVKWSNGAAALNRFLAATKMPCYCNGMGRGTVPHDSPYFFNRTRRDYLEQTDCVILAGSLLDFRMRFGKSIPADAKIIQLDLDATLIGQNRRADVGLVGNLGLTFERMLEVMTKDGVKLDCSAVVARMAHEGSRKRKKAARQADLQRGADRPDAHVQGDRRLRHRRHDPDRRRRRHRRDGREDRAGAEERRVDGSGPARHARRRHALRARRAARASPTSAC